MVFYVTMVTFLMTLLMNKFTSIAYSNFLLDCHILDPNNFVMKCCHG